MLNTTPASSLEPITSDLLVTVSGGCHKHRGCCGSAPVTQQTIVNMPSQILPQAPMPAPAAPTPTLASAGPSGDMVSTSVSINGQPAATA
jgi:hypothetical protein